MCKNLKQIALSAIGLVLLFVVASCNRQPLETATSPSDFAAYLDQRVPRLLDRYDVPGVSMALVRDGQLVWSGVYGYADREQARKMTVLLPQGADHLTRDKTDHLPSQRPPSQASVLWQKLS